MEEKAGKLQAETLLTLARVLLLVNGLDECTALLDRAVKVEPDLRDVHYERARLLMKKGDAGALRPRVRRPWAFPLRAFRITRFDTYSYARTGWPATTNARPSMQRHCETRIHSGVGDRPNRPAPTWSKLVLAGTAGGSEWVQLVAMIRDMGP
jgi:hypothetical protein